MPSWHNAANLSQTRSRDEPDEHGPADAPQSNIFNLREFNLRESESCSAGHPSRLNLCRTPVRAVISRPGVAKILSLPLAGFRARLFGREPADFCAGRRLRIARTACPANARHAGLWVGIRSPATDKREQRATENRERPAQRLASSYRLPSIFGQGIE